VDGTANRPEHHGQQALDFTSVFTSWPLEMLHHGGDTAAVLAKSFDRHHSCSLPIDFLELVISILLDVRIDCRAVFDC